MTWKTQHCKLRPGFPIHQCVMDQSPGRTADLDIHGMAKEEQRIISGLNDSGNPSSTITAT